MLEPLRTKQVGSVHIIPLADDRFVALGSNKFYDSTESIAKSFSRSAKFNDNLYVSVTEIEGGYKATLVENTAITVYSFKGLTDQAISDVICADNNLKPNAEFLEYLGGTFEEALVAVEQQEGNEHAVGLTRVLQGIHHSILLAFEKVG
ncbi:MAG: hypothetical protein V4616_10885 [Bacteroidota bacterium]